MRCEEDPDIPVPDFGTLTGVYYLVKCIFHPVMFSLPQTFDGVEGRDGKLGCAPGLRHRVKGVVAVH